MVNEPIYTTAILRLAAEIPHDGRLASPDASVERRSVVCGSRVTVDVVLGADDRVASLGLEIRACALGQASASLMAAQAVGRNAAELVSARDDLAAWLAGRRDDAGVWSGLDALAPARRHSSRHAAILLPFEAVAAAATLAARKAAA